MNMKKPLLLQRMRGTRRKNDRHLKILNQVPSCPERDFFVGGADLTETLLNHFHIVSYKMAD